MSATVRLGDIARIIGGGTPDRSNPDYWGGMIPWVTVKDVQSERITGSSETITELGLNKSASNLIPPGSIVVPTRMALGRAAINDIPIAINQDLKALLVDSAQIDRDFLHKFLLSKAAYFEARGKGATVKGITLDVLTELEIPNLPLDEQRRIAAILDKADAIHKKRRATLKLADEFLRSVFLDMFGDPATNPKGWPTQPLGSLCEVRTGATPSRDRPGYYSGNIPWVKTGEVDQELIVDCEERISELAIAETNCKVFPVGTILIAMYGQGKTRGKCGVLGMPAATNQACAAVLPTDSINNSYLFQLTRANYESIRSLAHGGNQENLNLGMIKDIDIPVPPAMLQKQFADIANMVSRIKVRQKETLQQAESLFASASISAFSARL